MEKNTQKPTEQAHKSNQKIVPSMSKNPVKKTGANGTNGAKKNDQLLPKIEMPMNVNNIYNKGLLYFILGTIAMIFFFSLFSSEPAQEISISELVQDIRNEQVEKIVVSGDELRATYSDESLRTVQKESGQSAVEIFEAANLDLAEVELEVEAFSFGSMIWELVISLLPILLMIGFFFIIFRQAKGGQAGIMGIGKSKAKLFVKGKQNTSFNDVGGMDEAKKELEEVVDFLKNPKKYAKVGARTPKGVLLVGPAGTGKCVTGDTIVWTNKGLMEIREIPRYYYVDPQSHQVAGAGLTSFNLEDTVATDQLASHWYDLGEQETIKVQLKQGLSLEGTPEHPVVVMTSEGKLKFRQLKDLQLGDQLAIQYGSQAFGNLDLVDEDTAYLMGLLTGDGNMSHSSRVGLTNIDDEIITFFKRFVLERFGEAKLTKNNQSYLVSNWDFKRYLYQMGMSYLLSFDKAVPPTILQAKKAVQVKFLQGLFDADGSIGKTRAEFEYTTVSERMARQVQMMLLNLGVVASLNEKGRVANGYKRPVYRITLTGDRLKVFGQQVGFMLTRKQQLLEAHLDKKLSSNTNIDIIPGISQLMVEAWTSLSEQQLSHEKLSKTIDKVRRRLRVSRNTLTEFVRYCSALAIEVPHLEYLRSLLEANLFFSPVVQIQPAYNRVYDFTVPKTHSFLGNGLINHNTLLARAVAGEANVQFLSIAGSEFMEMLVGVGASRVRDLFTTAKKLAPSIIFIDEIDAIGQTRGKGSFGGHDEREQTLNQILVEMDGFDQNDNVIVMAATNRGDMLDAALIRPGRFDRRVMVRLPDLEERKYIISIHAKGKPFAKEVKWERVAKRTVGFSGADIENMLNEAAIAVARESRKEITMEDIEEAALKVKLGPSKKQLSSKLERTMTAYHEAGHAIVAHASAHADAVTRISIVSRGHALGFTVSSPERDKFQTTKSELLDRITVLLGGRAAEQMIFNEQTAGAGNDIERATRIARAMVVEYGMSELGAMNYAPLYDNADYGRSWNEPLRISDRLQEKVDEQVNKIIQEGEKRAAELLKTHKKKLDKVSNRLLEIETLDGDEFARLMGFKKIKIDDAYDLAENGTNESEDEA